MATKKKTAKKPVKPKARKMNRRFTEKQEKWRREYMAKFFGIEPCMDEDAYREGKMSFREYAEVNLRWIVDHAECVANSLRIDIP